MTNLRSAPSFIARDRTAETRDTHDSFIPALDDLALADGELERLLAGLVEHLAVGQLANVATNSKSDPNLYWTRSLEPFLGCFPLPTVTSL